jgi:hypothetical protein
MCVPLADATIKLVASAGVHYKNEPPFEHINDLTYRLLPQQADPKLLRPSHPSSIRQPGLEDINRLPLPADRGAGPQGFVSAPTANHVSMQGAIKRLITLASDPAPAMAQTALDERADAVLLIPF